MKRFGFLLLATAALFASCSKTNNTYDVVIVGGGASGTAAAVQAARMGSSVLLVEEHDWLGGMLTSAGVSATDGNYKLRGAFWGEFRDSLEAHYGGKDSLITGWVSNTLFEPSVGDRIFKNIVAAENNITVWYKSAPTEFKRENAIWNIKICKKGNNHTVSGKIVIDATELGDIAKMLGVKYDIGMDSREVTKEDIAPEKANDIIQDLTYVMVLKDYGQDVTIAEPKGYDPKLFYCSSINDKCVSPKEGKRLWAKDMMITYGKLPNNKYMINWPIEGNDYYVDIIELDPQQRADSLEKAKWHSLCFLYYMQTELGFNTLGLADDEFQTEDMLPLIPYHRESRRIHGLVQFNLNDISDPYNQPTQLYRTAIGVGDYPVDHHHARYSGWGELPNLYFHPVPSYGLPLGVIIPKDVDGLLVAEKSISVTNIVNGSTRLQPVVLQIGQAAGALAALAAQQNKEIKDVAVRDVQTAILDAGGYLLPYLDRPATDPHFKAMQRIGVTGIIKGVGMNVGWENQTWFKADSTITTAELGLGLEEFFPKNSMGKDNSTLVTLIVLFDLIVEYNPNEAAIDEKTWINLGLKDYDQKRPLTRLECAVIIDHIFKPFEKRQVDITGKYIN